MLDGLTDKKALRSRLRALRSQQDAGQARSSSALAQEALLASPLWQKARSVALYAATQGEVGAEKLFACALSQGKQAWFPRVRPEGQGLMDFVRVLAADELRPGRFGILEPIPSLPGVAAEDFACDLAVIPGVAFTLAGARLGFGGGFYDRFFAGNRVRTRVGFCFSFQIVPVLQCEPWDVLMTHICSEQGLVAVGS